MEIMTAAEDPVAYLKDCVKKIRTAKMKGEREALMEALRGASAEQQRSLLARIGEIDKELNRNRFV